MIISRILKLVGVHKDSTQTLNGKRFKDGEHTVTGDEHSVERICNYFVRSFSAQVFDADGTLISGEEVEPEVIAPETTEDETGDSNDGAVQIPESESNGIALDVESSTESDELGSGEGTIISDFAD